MTTIEEIRASLEEEKEKRLKSYEMDKGYAMCRTYLDNNRMTKADHLLEIDLWECIKCLLYIRSGKQIPIETCEKISNIMRKLFDSLDYDTYRRITDSALIMCDLDDKNKETAFRYIEESNKVQSLLLLRSISEKEVGLYELTDGDYEDNDLKRLLKELRELDQKKGKGIIREFVQFIDQCGDYLSKIFSLIDACKTMQLEHDNVSQTLSQVVYLREKERRKIARDFVRKSFDEQAIVGEQNIIRTFVNEEEKKLSDSKKEEKRLQRIYKKIEECLTEAETKDEVTNIREIVKNIQSDELKRKILEWIYLKNRRVYDSLEEELERLSSNSVNHYLALLNRYNINIHPKDIPTITHHSLEVTEEIITLLPMGLFTSTDVLRILQTTTLEIARKIKEYLEKGYLTRTAIFENRDLYEEKKDKLKALETAYSTLNQVGLNPKLFSESPEILWENVDRVCKNIELLNTYHLLSSVKNAEDLTFFQEQDLVEKVDLLIELGYYSYLEEDITLLLVPKKRLKRLELLKSMNIPIEDMEELYEVLESSRFIVKEEDLENYLLDVMPYKEEFSSTITLDVLEKKSQDKVVVDLNGVTLSLPKIEREVQKGLSVSEAIFKKQRWTLEEYQKVEEALKPYQKTKSEN